MNTYISGNKKRFYVEKYGTVTSTNDIIKEKAKAGAPEGTVVLAEAQTAGRGRRGKKFLSPLGGGIYMSILLRQKNDTISITTLAAVAVAKVIEKHTGRTSEIKWVNDIFQNGKKICGILTEGQRDATSGGLSYAILGIGINLKEPQGGFPEELRDIAGAAFKENEAFDRDAIVEDILNELFYGCQNHFEEYVKRSMIIGKAVTVLQNSKPLYNAKVLEVERDFSLKILLDDGNTAVIKSGEVSVKM